MAENQNTGQQKPENKGEGQKNTGSGGSGNQNQNQQQQNSNQKKRYYHRNRRRYGGRQQGGKGPQKSKRLSFRKVTILVPLLNEEESLRPLYNEIKKALTQVQIDYQLLFIDDGSTDGSLKIIKELAHTDKKINYFSFRKNFGKSAALQLGFKNATGDVIITMDADLQDDPREIESLLKKLDEGYDLVSGWKKTRHDPFIKKHSSKFFNFITRLMSKIKIHDFNCGLKAYRAEVVKELHIHGELHRYIPVLAGWKGFTITEIPVKHHPRRYGKTKFGISRFFKGFIDLITVMFTTRYNKRPMHLFGFLGALSFLAGLIVNGVLTYDWLRGHALSNRPLLFLGMLLIIVGVQLFTVGLLGEMVAHNSMDDSEYSIKEKR